MIKNNSISLEKYSNVREDAINTIKYTMLFDYHPPKYEEDVNVFFSSLFKCCQECCYRVFMDIKEKHKTVENSNHFFGMPGIWYDSVLNNFSTFPPLSKLNEIDIFTPSMYNYIFQHCIISSYHAIQTELNNQKGITSFSMFHDETNSRKRSSKASNFKTVSKNHLKSLPFTENLVMNYSDSDSQMFSPLFGDCWKDICKINSSNYDFIYNSSNDAYERFKHILDVNEKLYCNAPKTTTQIHKQYLLERIFNFDIFYNILLICEALDEFSPKGNYDLSFFSKNPNFINQEFNKSISKDMAFRSEIFKRNKMDIIRILSHVTELPNTFNRKYFPLYALEMITEGTDSYRNFWENLSWNNDITVIAEERSNKPRGFNYEKWREQFNFFINYLSELVFPVYEWCFLGMLMESIEEKYNPKSYDDHLKIAQNILKKYINDKNILLSDPQLSNDFSIELFFKTFVKDNKKPYTNEKNAAHRYRSFTRSDISLEILELLVKAFYDNKPDFNLNLSKNLTPSYFRFKTDTSLEGPTLKVRKLYFDILKGYHFKKLE